MKKFYVIITFIIFLLACSQEEDYSQLQDWRSELRTEILEARRNVNSTSDLTIRSEIFVSETINFYIWIKNHLADGYVDKTCDDELFEKTIRSQLSAVELLIQISEPTEDPFELFPLPSEIIHVLGSEGAVGLEKDTFNLIDSNTLEWNVEFGNQPLMLEKNDGWYIVP
ncbi:MAG: hypothetical protein FI676_01485, partial [SAR202 cluster bacterium]|nr:hypothetical protein [SAR202 cluster bacterium]